MKPATKILIAGGAIGATALFFLRKKLPPSLSPLVRYPSPEEREDFFGPLLWEPLPHTDNIKILNDFESEELVPLDLSLLHAKNPALPSSVLLHRHAAPVFQRFFLELDRRGLLPLIRSFDGAWNPRRTRGKAFLSAHAYGTAIDLNAASNPVGSPGNRENTRLAEIALPMGIFWGGHFQGAKDPMQFEVVPGTFDQTEHS